MTRSSKKNDQAIVEYLTANGPKSRGEITKATGIKWTPAYDSLMRLYHAGKVSYEAIHPGEGRTRPTTYWSVKE